MFCTPYFKVYVTCAVPLMLHWRVTLDVTLKKVEIRLCMLNSSDFVLNISSTVSSITITTYLQYLEQQSSSEPFYWHLIDWFKMYSVDDRCEFRPLYLACTPSLCEMVASP